jgi:hypothetical protein
VGNFGLQSPSIQLNCSNFWLSQRQPLDWKKDAPNGASYCVFLAILNRKTTIYASFFAPEKLVFCISSCSTHDMFCLLLRAPNRA